MQQHIYLADILYSLFSSSVALRWHFVVDSSVGDTGSCIHNWTMDAAIISDVNYILYNNTQYDITPYVCKKVLV